MPEHLNLSTTMEIMYVFEKCVNIKLPFEPETLLLNYVVVPKKLKSYNLKLNY